MSGYYVGYHGSALVLREDEYDEMIETYQKKIVSRLKEPLREDFQNLVIDQDCLLSEYPFIRSSYLECDPNEILEDEDEANAKVFDIINISADEFDGMLLIPYWVCQVFCVSFKKIFWGGEPPHLYHPTLLNDTLLKCFGNISNRVSCQ